MGISAIFSIILLLCGVSSIVGDIIGDLWNDHVLSKNMNLTRNGERVHPDDVMIPSYECKERGNESMSLPSWHHSCKKACTNNIESNEIAIELLKWESNIGEFPLYKMTAMRVCYVSHVNIWGSCSQSQFRTPHKISETDLHQAMEYADNVPGGIIDNARITNSKESSCSYWNDIKTCGTDISITAHNANLYKGKTEDEYHIVSSTLGIKFPYSQKRFIIRDTAYFWDVSVDIDKHCAWKQIGRAKCHISKHSRIMRCPEIGYSYDLADLKVYKNCKREVYAGGSTVPFSIISTEAKKLVNQQDVFEKAKEGKEDKDVNLIKEINKALDGIEKSYCESTCDILSRTARVAGSQVMTTPLGHWLYVPEDLKLGKREHLSICKLTSEWTISNPFTTCGFSKFVIVRSKETGNIAVWDISTEYILSNETCANIMYQLEIPSLLEAYKSKAILTLTAWNGDMISIKYPYKNFEITRPPRVRYHRDPHWLSHVELNEGDLITSDDIGSSIRDMMNRTIEEANGNMTQSGILRSLFDEVAAGAESALVWAEEEVEAVFGSIRKVFVLIIIGLLLYLVSRIVSLITKTTRKKKRRSTVRFNDDVLITPATPYTTTANKRSSMRSIFNDSRL